MTMIAAATCCCGDACSFCNVSSWTASGFGGGTLTWEAVCEEVIVDPFPPFYVGVEGTITYTVPASIVMAWQSQDKLCCTWFGETAWSSEQTLDACADCGADLSLYPYSYRFKTEATLSICETSFGSGVYEAALLVVVLLLLLRRLR